MVGFFYISFDLFRLLKKKKLKQIHEKDEELACQRARIEEFEQIIRYFFWSVSLLALYYARSKKNKQESSFYLLSSLFFSPQNAPAKKKSCKRPFNSPFSPASSLPSACLLHKKKRSRDNEVLGKSLENELSQVKTIRSGGRGK